MREIKFRAQNLRGIWVIFTLESLMNFNADTPDDFSQWKNWCEYTGLKDKNGKEIFEGDIVRVRYSCEGGFDSFVGVVKYKEDRFAVVDEVAGGGSTTFHFPHNEHEVIGNIYENGELLTKSQPTEGAGE